jgi:hypothetical protein
MPDIDVDQTDILVDLFKTPREQRNADWFAKFYAAVPTAAFHVVENEEIFSGPDGFPYLRLIVPPADQEFRGFSLKVLLEQALDQGVGAVIFPETGQEPLWVFTYGNLLSLRITGTFDARESANMALKTAEDPAEQKPREVMLAQPSEQFLPKPARKILKKYLQLNGVGMPAMLLLNDTSLSPPQQLVFNLFRENYENDEHFKQVVQRLTWYMPPSYAIAVVPKGQKEFTDAFAAM